MKTGKRIGKKAAVLLIVFVVAAIVYFVWPMRNKESQGTVSYTAMEAATLPVVYPQMMGREMAPLFGHMEEKAVTAGRDSLLVLPEDRALAVRIEETGQAAAIRYEIRSLDMEHLVERTEVNDWQRNGEEISATLHIQNLLEKEQEYILGLNLDLADGRSVWYYTRIVETDREHIGEMLALAEEFSLKTLDYGQAQDLTMYMESSTSADNSSYGQVTLKNSFTLMTWGSLEVVRDGKARMTLKELSGDLANIQLDYSVIRTEEDQTEHFAVSENFTMKWSTQRIYMMDYERRMDQLFTGDRSLFSGKRIILGIGSGEDIYAKDSPDGKFMAFVVNRELWAYDGREKNNGRSIRIFSFGGADVADVRANYDRHGIEILEVDENGGVDFLVYGYMNRGSHEGETGVAYYRYEAENNTLEERFFLPAPESYEQLKMDVECLAHKGGNGILYLYMNETVYGVDLTSCEYIVVASGLTGDKFAVSGDGSRLAWQEETGVYDSSLLHIMDLDTGEKTQLGGKKTDAYRILGFVGNDCVYGVGEAGDYILSNGRVMGLYLKRLDIVDKGMNSVMSYEKEGTYIREVAVDSSRIHIKNVRNRGNGFFGAVSEDTLVCNAETLPGRMDDIGWYASETKGRVYFVQFAGDISSDLRIRSVTPEKLASEDMKVIRPETMASSETLEFYAYGRGRYLGRFLDFSDAVAAAYDSMGFVSAGKDKVIWVRANKPNSYYIRDLTAALRRIERNRESFLGSRWAEDESLMLELSGCTLNQVLYYVGQNVPVLVYTGEGSFLYLTGYDQGHVRVYDPAAGDSETWDMESAETYFSGLGNDYICCIFAK